MSNFSIRVNFNFCFRSAHNFEPPDHTREEPYGIEIIRSFMLFHYLFYNHLPNVQHNEI